jgi:hypothetical protein
VPVGNNQKAPALFYYYSTPTIQRNNGFRIISAGLHDEGLLAEGDFRTFLGAAQARFFDIVNLRDKHFKADNHNLPISTINKGKLGATRSRYCDISVFFSGGRSAHVR